MLPLLVLLLLPHQSCSSTLFDKISLTKFNPKAICNDGTDSAMYLYKNDPKTLLIYFQGGFQCYSNETCQERYHQSVDYMSSRNYPARMALDGILADSQANNKAFFNSTKVYLPYCSSDVFSGNFSSWGF
jgi:hypothetical protein